MSIRNIVWAAVAAMLLTACAQEGEYYDKSPSAIMSAIEKTTVPTALMGNNIVGSRASRPREDTVLIAMTNEIGGEEFRIVVQVTPDGNGSRVISQVQTPRGEVIADNAGPIHGDLAQKFANEIVAAAIEDREFDMLFATNPAAKAMLGSNSEIGKQVQDAGAAMTAMSKLEQDMAKQKRQEEFEKEYGEDWGASGSSASDDWAK